MLPVGNVTNTVPDLTLFHILLSWSSKSHLRSPRTIEHFIHICSIGTVTLLQVCCICTNAKLICTTGLGVKDPFLQLHCTECPRLPWKISSIPISASPQAPSGKGCPAAEQHSCNRIVLLCARCLTKTQNWGSSCCYRGRIQESNRAIALEDLGDPSKSQNYSSSK